ncbi:MAG: hypothetical protein MH204_02970 [Fimbriimonadaceae bacterium]|nr:hypothetical protein [Fimbriimonadaceae bacterium]
MAVKPTRTAPDEGSESVSTSSQQAALTRLERVIHASPLGRREDRQEAAGWLRVIRRLEEQDLLDAAQVDRLSNMVVARLATRQLNSFLPGAFLGTRGKRRALDVVWSRHARR